MDDPSSDAEQIRRALREIRAVNYFLGGYRALRKALTPLFRKRAGLSDQTGRRTLAPGYKPLTIKILDLGTGLADYPALMVKWGAGLGLLVHVSALDANPIVVSAARAYLDQALPSTLRKRVDVLQGDALPLSFDDDSFDVVTASLFLHHFDDEGAKDMLKEMSRVAREGIIVNDLHRHPIAYLGIRLIAGVLPVSEMFANDGPLSVRRGFRPDELQRMAETAQLTNVSVDWYWAFRLVLSSLP